MAPPTLPNPPAQQPYTSVRNEMVAYYDNHGSIVASAIRNSCVDEAIARYTKQQLEGPNTHRTYAYYAYKVEKKAWGLLFGRQVDFPGISPVIAPQPPAANNPRFQLQQPSAAVYQPPPAAAQAAPTTAYAPSSSTSIATLIATIQKKDRQLTQQANRNRQLASELDATRAAMTALHAAQASAGSRDEEEEKKVKDEEEDTFTDPMDLDDPE